MVDEMVEQCLALRKTVFIHVQDDHFKPTRIVLPRLGVKW